MGGFPLFRLSFADVAGSPRIWSVETLEFTLDPEEGVERKQLGAVKPLFEELGSPRIELENRGTLWPAIIGGRRTAIPWILREDVVDFLCKEMCCEVEAMEVTLTKVPKSLSGKLKPVKYYAVIPRSVVDVESRRYGTVDQYGRSEYHRLVPVQDSWDGSTICRGGVGKNLILCSREFIDRARRERWENFRFEPIDLMRAKANRGAVSEPVDYLGDAYPPSDWYPEYHYELVRELEGDSS